MSSDVDAQEIGYEEFGARFVRRAVVQRRIAAALAGLGNEIKVGPIKGLILTEAMVHGRFGEPLITPRDSDLVRYDVTFPVSLDLIVRIANEIRVGGDLLIHLVLTARAAQPLKLFIEIDPLTADDLHLQLRVEGPGSSLLRNVGVLDKEIRRQVANLINARLNEPASIAKRTIDVAARIDETEALESGAPPRLCDYGAFGTAFFHKAVTTARIEAAVADVAGRTTDIGPLKAGPKDMAEVSAHGVVGAPTVNARTGTLVAFDLLIPVDLDLSVTLGHGNPNTFRGRIEVPVELLARAAEPLLVVLDAPPVTPEQVRVDLHADGFVAGVLKKAGGIEKQVAVQVARAVNEQLEASRGARVVDVGARIDAS